MSKSKLFVTQLDSGSRSYYVREVGRTMKVLGPLFETAEEAFELLWKCEADEEFAYWQRVYALNSAPNPREDTRNMTDMTKTEKIVLGYLFTNFDSDICVQTFRSLSEALDITERQAKTACRRLKRRGFAEHSPYWNSDENSLLGGSGYTISNSGIWMARQQRALEAISEIGGSSAITGSAE